MLKNSRFFNVIIILFFINGCFNRNNNEPDKDYTQYKEPLIKVNSYLVDKDSLLIEQYCKRRNLKMNVTLYGLWYKIYHTGNGDSARPGKVANIKYKLKLLDGKVCYDSDSLGILSFKIGYEDIESGLDKGIRMLREGDSAIFILPPSLAHGLLGDFDCIPPRSIVVYELKLIKVTDK